MIMLIQPFKTGRGKFFFFRPKSQRLINQFRVFFFPPSLSLSIFLLAQPFYLIITSSIGFLIIPKRIDSNQTRTFDRDKLTAFNISSNNLTVPNSISDSSKVTSTFKNLSNKYKSSLSDGSKFRNKSASSVNQLNVTTTTPLPIVEVTYFSTVNFTNITAQVGSIVEIPCTVHHLAEGTVSFLIYN